jgi:lipoyl(octanoyl) transferase
MHVQRLGCIDYPTGLVCQERALSQVRDGGPDVLLLLQHEPVFTFGRRVRPEHLRVSRAEIAARGAPLYETDRGGSVTFHGPGQLVAYPIVDLRRRGVSALEYVRGLEETMLRALSDFRVPAERVEGCPGVWCESGKIGAVGVRVRRGVTTHGFALNVSPDLTWYDCIVPCGLEAPVTSMAWDLGYAPSISDVEAAVEHHFASVFGVSRPSIGATAWR